MYASQHATSSSSDDPPTLPEHLGVQGDPLERITSPLPSNRVNELAEPPALTAQPDLIEQAVTRLNEAAHLIEQEEDQNKNDRKPRLYSRASRLSPIVDISADIRRESTPLPKIPSTAESTSNSSLVDSDSALPDYWPWLEEDAEESPAEPVGDPLLEVVLAVFLPVLNRRESKKRICVALWSMEYQQGNFLFHFFGVILLVYVSSLLPLRFLRSWLS